VVASDPDAGDVLTFSLVPASHAVFNISSGGVVRVKAATINFEVTSSYTLQIRVTDVGGLFADNFLSVSVVDVNEAPTLSATTRSIAENVVLGSSIGAPIVAADVDANEVFTWAILSGANSAIAIDSSGQLTTTAAIDFESTSVYTLTVRVTDKGGLTASATVTVNVINVNEAPVFVSSSISAKSVAENSPAWATVGSVVTSTDVDAGQTRTYAIPAGQDVFVIGSVNGSISLARPVLDFETKSSYSLTVVVTDNGLPPLSTTATVTIQLVDVNEAPSALFKGLTLRVDENSAVGAYIGNLPASDVDAADSGRLVVKFVNSAYSNFTLTAATGDLRVLAALDFETLNVYTFSAYVNDTGGLMDSGSVTVNVVDVNEAPVIVAQSRNISENSPKNALVGAAILASDVDAGQLLAFTITGGNSAGIFAINPCSGQITVTNPTLNFEALSSYVLTVQVQDDGSPRLAASASISISVLDVNEAPILSASSFSVQENSAVGTVVGVQLSTDPDTVDNKTFSIVGGTGSSVFSILTNGTLTVRTAVLDFETTASYSLLIMVMDKGGLNDTQPFTVTILDVNEAPVVPAQTVSVAENSGVGTQLSAPVSFSDQDRNSVVFSIVGGNGSSLFSIDSDSGVLSVLVASLNFEVAPVYTLTVNAQDNGVPSLAGQGTITVQLLDVNEAPTAPATVSLSVAENSVSGTQVGVTALNASDVDSASYTRLTWAITATGPSAASFFTVTSGGVVSLIASPNFESQSVFTFTATVTDQGGLSASSAVTVTILNVNERPVLDSGSYAVTIAENLVSGSDVLRGGSRTDICAFNEDAGQSLT
jgi:hypothetical protein